MSFFKIVKFLLRISLLLVTIVFIGLVLNSANNARIMDYFSFHDSLNKKLDQAHRLVKAVQQKANTDSSSIDAHGDTWFYRFDENLDELVLLTHSDNPFVPSRDLEFSFDDPLLLSIKPSSDQFNIDSGILSYRHSLENVLTNPFPLAIDKDATGDIEIRIKVTNFDEMQLCWSAAPDVSIDDHGKIEKITFSVIPDGDFHIYRVPGLVMASWLHSRDRMIRKIYLAPSDPSIEAPVEIDYIRFTPRDEKFARHPFGKAYEKINAEMRKLLYLHSGHELQYRLNIPEKQTFLKFGTAALKESDISISLNIHSEGIPEMEIVHDGTFSGWRDEKIDISQFSGREVIIRFSANADIANIAFFSSPIVYCPPAKKQNFVIALEDSLRSDRMSCYGYKRETTPVKDEWRHEGALFKKAFSQSSFTRSSCASLMTSLYPSATGVWNNADRLSEEYDTLAEVLYKNGFATALFSQNTNVGPFSGLHQGFDTVIDNETVGKRAPDIYGSAALEKWLADHSDQNVFVFIHVLDPHYPFNPPEEVSAPYRDKDYLIGRKGIPHDKLYDPSWLKRVTFESRNFLYDEEVRYNDLHFPNLLDIIKRQGGYERTWLTFIGDHGEHLGEHYLWNHQPPNYRRVLQVPVIMVYPDFIPAGASIDQPIQLIDIMPTLLDVAGVDLNQLIIQGDSLKSFLAGDIPWPELDQRICIADEVRFSSPSDVIANGGIFYKQFHVMTSDRHADMISHHLNEKGKKWFNLFSRTQVFDMGENPDETANLVNFLADGFFTYQVRTFQNRFRSLNLLLHREISGSSGKSVVYDNKTIEQLKSLGYIQ